MKFEGFGKRLGYFHPFPCALDGSTPQQAPSFDVSTRSSTPHSSSRRLKATACLRLETSLNVGTPAEYKCETGGQYLATGSDEQHASVLDFSSCFERVESVQCRVSRVNAMLSPARHLTPVEHSLTARGGACGVALCCSRCGSVLVDGESDTCGCACRGHMDVTCSIRVWNTVMDKLRDVFIIGLGKQSQSVRVPGPGFGNHSKA